MSVQFRPLNKVHQFMNEIGYEPGYAYDDLVFSNDAVFIVQFSDEKEQTLKLFINQDCIESESDRIKTQYKARAEAEKFNVQYSGSFSLVEQEKTKEIDIHFN